MQQLETISQIGNAEIQPIENEIHAFLASLQHVKFYGELTLYCVFLHLLSFLPQLFRSEVQNK